MPFQNLKVQMKITYYVANGDIIGKTDFFTYTDEFATAETKINNFEQKIQKNNTTKKFNLEYSIFER
jgi:hypothetical protein